MGGAAQELGLIERGNERQTHKLRTQIYAALVGAVVFATAPGLLFVDQPHEVLVIVACVAVALVACLWVADRLMAPVYALRRRLEVRNYGDEAVASGSRPPESDIDLGAGGFELGALLASVTPSRRVDLRASLPVELAAIEKLARAGRVSEIAMDSVKRDLFRHLSHQLKNPLALVRAHAETAHQAVDLREDDKARENLTAIAAVSLNMSKLVELLLSMAWVEGMEEQGLAGKRANLSAVIMETANTRRRLAGDKGMTIECRVDAGLWVRGMRELLQEMVASLVDNAIRYAPSATAITLEASRLPGTRTVVLIVADRGPGIPPQERERVFEPFYGSIGLDARGNMTYGTRRHRALGAGVDKTSHGLGLALVRAVVKLHGATIKLDSGPDGIGLSARVLLPATEPPAEQPDQQA